jgi:hypothetical protein
MQTMEADKFNTATHLLRDGWFQAADARIEQLEQIKRDADDEITEVRESKAAMKEFTEKVVGRPRVMLVEWTANDQRMTGKWSAQSAGDRSDEQKAA